jgi:glyoxylase-like metal-dependent hydrolase (beta-lactamase superfamily II)
MAAASRAANEMPTETFSGGNMSLSIGGLEIELIYKGGHKPDQTILWLPQQKVLLPSDLIFENCYPYMIGSDIPVWIDVLKSLSDFDADVIFPGHGTFCNQEVIDSLIDYMKTSWEITAAHIEKGDSLEIILKDPALPRPKGWERETRFETNIETIYDQILAKQVP